MPNEPKYHVAEEMLLEHALGHATQAEELVVAMHLRFCASCRQLVAQMEQTAGEILMAGEGLPTAVRDVDDLPGSTQDAIDVIDRVDETLAGSQSENRFVGWRRVGRKLRYLDLAAELGDYPARLVYLSPGLTIPKHGHGGVEYTLVLEGGLAADDLALDPGDVLSVGPDDQHEIVADRQQGCLALIVQSGPIQPKTFKGRLIKLFVRGF